MIVIPSHFLRILHFDASALWDNMLLNLPLLQVRKRETDILTEEILYKYLASTFAQCQQRNSQFLVDAAF